MSLPSDLLRQAEQLSRLEPRRPRQASLRRAVSTAYYALFHRLVSEATRALVADPSLRGRFARSFDHQDMKEASKAFANSQPNQPFPRADGLTIPAQLARVASTFVALQEARHEADYDVDKRYTRLESTIWSAASGWPSGTGRPSRPTRRPGDIWRHSCSGSDGTVDRDAPRFAPAWTIRSRRRRPG